MINDHVFQTKPLISWLCRISLVAFLLCLAIDARADDKQPLFNGRDLAGWDGDKQIWSVRDGAIVGSTVDHKIKSNTFLVWQGGELGNFRLTYKARLEGDNNSGVQYRSELADPKTWRVVGYQADMHVNPEYTAMLFGEGTGRHIIALRGTKATLETDPNDSTVDEKAFPVTPIDLTKWHEYSILAEGNRLVHQLDGVTTVDITDNHEKKCDRGIIALQVHAGPPMTVFFKDIVLEKIADGKLQSTNP